MGSLTVRGIQCAGPGRHADGDGLYLLVKPSGARSWVLRIQQGGQRRDIGLGTAERSSRSPAAAALATQIPILLRRSLTLSEAREKSDILRRMAKAGLDPAVERDRDRKALPSFEGAAIACHRDLQSGWSAKNAISFLSSLREHAFPVIGRLRIDQVDAPQIHNALAAIWTAKPEMARKVRQRIGTVLNYAHSKGWRPVEAPSKSVTMGLGKLATGGNLAAMPYSSTPAFVSALAAKPESVGRLALLFTIHTAARSGEVRRAQWQHIDLPNKLWSRPAELMKTREAHSVTLTDDAIGILERAKQLNPGNAGDLIFPSARKTPLSDMTLSKIMRDEKQPFTVHGFRSSFRDWAAEKMPHIPDPVAEAALAHAVPDKVERAYKRTSFIDMRRTLLNEWATHLTGRVPVRKTPSADDQEASVLAG